MVCFMYSTVYSLLNVPIRPCSALHVIRNVVCSASAANYCMSYTILFMAVFIYVVARLMDMLCILHRACFI